jgi:hypothetical protein
MNPEEIPLERKRIAARVREIRYELFGEHGAPLLADAIGVPSRAWINYERGASIPCEVALSFIEVTNANPQWLLRGRGRKYQRGDDGDSFQDTSTRN